MKSSLNMILKKYSSFVILQVLIKDSTPTTALNKVVSTLFVKDNFIIIAKISMEIILLIR